MSTTNTTGKTKAELVELVNVATKCLRYQLADVLARHDVYERVFGVGTQERDAGEATGIRHALYLLGAGDWDEIDAVAESMWPAAMGKLAESFDRVAQRADDPGQFAALSRCRDVARQMLAEHNEAHRSAA